MGTYGCILTDQCAIHQRLVLQQGIKSVEHVTLMIIPTQWIMLSSRHNCLLFSSATIHLQNENWSKLKSQLGHQLSDRRVTEKWVVFDLFTWTTKLLNARKGEKKRRKKNSRFYTATDSTTESTRRRRQKRTCDPFQLMQNALFCSYRGVVSLNCFADFCLCQNKNSSNRFITRKK